MSEAIAPHTVPITWLVRLRWGFVVAQAVTVLVGVVALDAPAKVLTGVVVGATLASNLVLRALGARGHTLRPSAVGAVFVLDTSALTALLFLSGGPSNPFSSLYLVYVTLAALTLGMRWAAVVVAVSGAGYALLFFSQGDSSSMMHMHHHDASAFSTHLQAMWLAFTLTATLIAYFVARVARELRQRERELADAQRAAARAEKLASLSALAAGAAHELGSPLASIAVAAKELARALEQSPELAEDTRLIRGEVDRCQRILREMSGKSGEPMGEVPETVGVDELVREVRQRTGASELPVQVDRDVPVSVVVPVRGLVQSLESLVRNALDAGGRNEDVRLRIECQDKWVRFEVEDRGVGIPREALARVGEPFFTTKPVGKGMGLGLFLASAFAQRWHGRLRVDSEVGQGTRARLEIPLWSEERSDVA